MAFEVGGGTWHPLGFGEGDNAVWEEARRRKRQYQRQFPTMEQIAGGRSHAINRGLWREPKAERLIGE
ncbi:hypothetical protein CDL15_Pgr016338 [Punica granatum]|uniref:Uncharacterized protein n=1 Tax=Punica granatum TaxID=22663 RepID=A0A218W6L4_PUNGR|nr:hypothetical protein CDL15_Pgr016338 [Punica granatum]